MFHYALRAFGLTAKSAPVTQYGTVVSISDQKSVCTGCADETLEHYQQIKIRDPKGNVETFIMFHDEVPKKKWGENDFIEFKTRTLPSDEFGSNKAIIQNGFDVIMLGNQSSAMKIKDTRLVA